MKKYILISFFFIFAFLSGCNEEHKNTSNYKPSKFISIGTGTITGTYYPTGGAFCRFVNMQKLKTNLSCSVESTTGSLYNLEAIHTRELDFAIAQGDTIYQDTKKRELRSIMAIYPEFLALIVRKDEGIHSLKDIQNKKINIDIPSSGTQATVKKFLHVKNINTNYFTQFETSHCPDLLIEKKIDGYFGMFGHPTANIKSAASLTNIDIIPLEGKEIDKLIEQYPYYVKGCIEKDLYEGIKKNIPTLGVKAILITNSLEDKESVYFLTKTILENFQTLKKAHPTFAKLTKKSLLEGLVIPLHPGAQKAFKEAGLL